MKKDLTVSLLNQLIGSRSIQLHGKATVLPWGFFGATQKAAHTGCTSYRFGRKQGKGHEENFSKVRKVCFFGLGVLLGIKNHKELYI